MVTMVVGVGEGIAVGSLSDAVTKGAARLKMKGRWLQVSCMLFICSGVVVDGFSGYRSEVEETRRENQVYRLYAI